jgi:hypothetical protein
MRIYEGSPRQDWEEVLRSIGAFADKEQLKELLLLELDGGFLLQGLALPSSGAWTESSGSLAKRTYELTDDQVGVLIDEGNSRRRSAGTDVPHADVSNYYEQALRVIGKFVDKQPPRELFFFEQDGSFVFRMLVAGGIGGAVAGHQLLEFTREDILAMIDEAPQHR